MNYETFKTSTVNSIQKYFGDKASVSLHSITKNNNIRMDGLIIQDSSINIAPTIYLNYYYEDYLAGKPLPAVWDAIIASYQDNLPQKNMDLSFFTDYNKVKYQIIYKLVNYMQNSELLKDVPHFRYLDLAVVFCCYLSDAPGGNASILIHNHHLDLWNVTADTLYELAVKNTPILLPYELKSMEDTLKTLCPDFPLTSAAGAPEHDSAMYVLSNTEKLYGASAILYPDILSYFGKLTGCDFYILPSSIHEVLLLPKDPHSNISDLNCIVRDVNGSQLLEEEILSDHAYIYDRSLGFITF